MKKTIITLALLSSTLGAFAGLKTTTLNGGTNNIAAATTNSTPLTAIPVTGSDNLAMQVSFLVVGGTTNNTFGVSLDRSIDNTTWETNFTFLVCEASPGIANVTQTNWNTGGFAYFRVSEVRNALTNAVTNLNVRFYYKLGL